MDQTHLLAIFSLKNDTELGDPLPRDIVVIVTDLTSAEDILRLEQAGAKIFRPPYSLRDILPSRAAWNEIFHHMWDKLWVFALTDYDRVLYLDSDMVLNRPVHPVWDSVNSWPEHGLSATADCQDPKQVPMRDGPYFNAGFMMIRPNQTLLEELLQVDLTDDVLEFAEQVRRLDFWLPSWSVT
jgi:hypothetical protein